MSSPRSRSRRAPAAASAAAEAAEVDIDMSEPRTMQEKLDVLIQASEDFRQRLERIEAQLVRNVVPLHNRRPQADDEDEQPARQVRSFNRAPGMKC
jgi:hypothetical protein